MQEGVGVGARMARKGLTADINLTKTQKQSRRKAACPLGAARRPLWRGFSRWGEKQGLKAEGRPGPDRGAWWAV